MYSDALGYRQSRWTDCREYSKRSIDMERVKPKLQPVVMNTLAVNKQMVIFNPFTLPSALLINMNPASVNPNAQTWDLFQVPVL